MTVEDLMIELPVRRDARGALSFAQRAGGFQFERVFWIYDVPEGSERGGHAHRTCTELLFAVHGSFDVELFDGKDRKVFHLDKPHQGLRIDPMVWCRLFNFSEGFTGVCLASNAYDAEGYIQSLEEFEREINRQ